MAPLSGEKTGPNPTDRGKLGTKRSVVTDARGIPIGFAVEGANVPDYKLLEATLDAMPVKPPETLAGPSLNLCLDKGYDYDGPRQIAYDYNLTAGQSGEARIFLIQDDNLTAEVPLRRSIL